MSLTLWPLLYLWEFLCNTHNKFSPFLPLNLLKKRLVWFWVIHNNGQKFFFLDYNFKLCTQFHTWQKILENLPGELVASNIKLFQKDWFFNASVCLVSELLACSLFRSLEFFNGSVDQQYVYVSANSSNSIIKLCKQTYQYL